MMNPTPAPWRPALGAPLSVRVAFATLDPAARRQLEAMLFEGRRCTQIARATGDAAADVRRRAGAALLAMHAMRTARDASLDGAVAALLALHALDALDPDETDLMDEMLAHQPALQRSYAELRELVGELCRMLPPVAPSPGVLARLRVALGDDRAAS